MWEDMRLVMGAIGFNQKFLSSNGMARNLHSSHGRGCSCVVSEHSQSLRLQQTSSRRGGSPRPSDGAGNAFAFALRGERSAGEDEGSRPASPSRQTLTGDGPGPLRRGAVWGQYGFRGWTVDGTCVNCDGNQCNSKQ